MSRLKLAVALLAGSMLAGTAVAAEPASIKPAACPSTPIQIVRSRGGLNQYVGTVAGVPDLCRMVRSDGQGDYYYGVWRDDWPGAGQAYPAIKFVVTGPTGTRQSFITRSVPGLQWLDSFINEGIETLTVDGAPVQVLRIAHEREGIEGNTYHSIITSWRDIATGANLKTVENQITGQSYGPDTTWNAVAIRPLP